MLESLLSGGASSSPETSSSGSMAGGNAVQLPPGRWHALADGVLTGQAITFDQALAVLTSPDEELLDLLAPPFVCGSAISAARCSFIF